MVKTITEVFYTVIERDADRVMLYKQGASWLPISSREFYRNTLGVAKALQDWGIGKGDRVAILSENRPEWPTAEFAALLIGAVVVPIYATLTAEQAAYMLSNSGARVLFLSTAEQLLKAQSVRAQTSLERIVAMDSIGVSDAVPMHRLMHAGPADRDPEFDARAQAAAPDDLASIIYTSGTTGTPKGAMLTQGNLASNLIHALDDFDLDHDDLSVSFLPLSHITARHVDYAMLYRGVTIAYCPDMNKLPQVVQEVKPTFFVGVPRVYEKIATKVQSQAASGLKRTVYNWAVKVGRKHRQELLTDKTPSSLDWKIADALLFKKVRAALGGRVKFFVSGGAPLGVDLAEWFADIGIVIHEGYGLTETSPVIALNIVRARKLGSVGQPLANVETRIADDGEIMVRGPSIFKGYWQMPEETRNAFEGEWFKTGDIGEIDSEGFLRVTDRKKELVKTSGGKFIAPAPIENVLKANELVTEAVVIGDRRKFPSVIICPNFELLEPWAQEKGIEAASRDDLVANQFVQQLYEGIVAEANQKLAKFEKIKKVLLIPDEFTIANGLLTPTMKLRRRAVEDRYREKIQQLYAEAEERAALK